MSFPAAVLFAACALAPLARAQEKKLQPEAPAEAPAVAPALAAWKVSEYVNLFSSCNAGAHLDNLAAELQSDELAEAYIVGYAPGGKEGEYGRRLLEVTKAYLVNSRGLAESRIKLVNGGRYKNPLEAATVLWVVPQGAEPPPVAEYADPPSTFEGKFAEYVGWDGYGDDSGLSWSSTKEATLAAFADQLRRQPKSVAYLVGYNFPGTAVGTWRRVLSKEAYSLEAEGVERGRVKIIYGGKAKGGEEDSSGGGVAKVQLWLAPQDAPPPVKEARKERRPKKSQLLARVPGYALGSDVERRAVEDLADVLREDEALRVFVVVKLPSLDVVVEPAEEGEGEEPEVDMNGLGESWRKELAKKHGVNENRVVVLVVPPGEDSSAYGDVEAWAVPPGAAPPDPFAKEDEAEEETGEANPKEF